MAIAQTTDAVKGCVVYCPPVNLAFELVAFLPELRSVDPEFGEFLGEISPAENVEKLKCPLFIFSARDDEKVKSERLNGYISELEEQGKAFTRAEVSSGGHYKSMISEGIPRGIEWLQALDAGEELPNSYIEPEFSSQKSFNLAIPPNASVIDESNGIGEKLAIKWESNGLPFEFYIYLTQYDPESLDGTASEIREAQDQKYREQNPERAGFGPLEEIPVKSGPFSGKWCSADFAVDGLPEKIDTSLFFMSVGGNLWIGRYHGPKSGLENCISTLEDSELPTDGSE